MKTSLLLSLCLAGLVPASHAGPQAAGDMPPPRLLIYPGDLTLVEEIQAVALTVGRTTARIDFVRGNADIASLDVLPLDHPAEVRVVAFERRNDLPNATFVELESSVAVVERLRVQYAARGLAAGIRYFLLFDPAQRQLDLIQEMEVTNNSGESFEQAAVDSVFGDVKKASSNAVMHGRAPEPAAGGPPGIPAPELRQDLADQSVLSFGAPLALPTGVVISRVTLEKSAVPLAVEHRFDATAAGGRVTRMLKIANTEDSGLGGVTLQPGSLRLAEKSGGQPERFLRTGALGHLPVGKELELDAGEARDMVVERDLLDLVRTDLLFGEYNRALISYNVEEAYRLEIRNHSNEARSLLVTEHIAGTETFEVVESTVKATKKDKSSVEFSVEVPAGETFELTYRVKKTGVKA